MNLHECRKGCGTTKHFLLTPTKTMWWEKAVKPVVLDFDTRKPLVPYYESVSLFVIVASFINHCTWTSLVGNLVCKIIGKCLQNRKPQNWRGLILSLDYARNAQVWLRRLTKNISQSVQGGMASECETQVELVLCIGVPSYKLLVLSYFI